MCLWNSKDKKKIIEETTTVFNSCHDDFRRPTECQNEGNTFGFQPLTSVVFHTKQLWNYRQFQNANEWTHKLIDKQSEPTGESEDTRVPLIIIHLYVHESTVIQILNVWANHRSSSPVLLCRWFCWKTPWIHIFPFGFKKSSNQFNKQCFYGGMCVF